MVTDRPDLMNRLVGPSGHSLDAVEVATTMLSLIESAEYQGGTVYEVMPNGERVVPQYGAASPFEGLSPDDMQAIGAIAERMMAPILAVTERERGV